MSIAPGTRFGHYEIHSLLGAGGMGEVYLAQDLSLRRRVAIKLLRADFTTNKHRVQRFEREAHAASSLNHPNILTIFEIGLEGDYHFIVTEFIDGEPLSSQIRRGPFKLDEVLDIGIQVSSALAAAHAAGIVHRDIKPENIMLRGDRLVKVLDFGLVKLNEMATDGAEEQWGVTNPGIIMGTPRYMSPEQARGQKIDARTDIWSLGVVLYQMISGALPFTGESTTDVIAAVLNAEATALTTRAPNTPVELERIVSKAMRKKQDERYQIVKDLELDLKNLKQRLDFQAHIESGASEGDSIRPHSTIGAATGAKTIELDQTDSLANRLQTTSSAEYLLSEIRQHKVG